MPNALRQLVLLGAVALLSAATSAPAESPVADAAMRRDAAAVRLLLKQGADVNAAQGDGMTACPGRDARDGGLARMLVYAVRQDAATRNGAAPR